MTSEAVCKNGHVVSSKVVDVARRLETVEAGVTAVRRVEVDRFCSECGAPVIVQCEGCSAPLAKPPWGSMAKPTDKPFCPRCGAPFPWARREQRVGQLVALLEHEHLDDVTRLAAVEAINELANTQPEAEEEQVVSAGRLRNLAPGAWRFMAPVLQGLISAGAKDKLGLS